MSLEVQTQEEQLQPLTQEEEKELATKLKELWTLGEQARSKALKRKKRIVKAYECQHEEIILKRNGSKAYLPWVYVAHESAQARYSNSLLPNDEDIFAMVGETEDDQAGADVMGEYLKSVYKEMGFVSKMDDAIKEWLFGEVILKKYWKRDERTFTALNPETGFPEKQKELLYNNVYTEIIPSDDFIIYPISGDMSRTSCGHRVWRHKDELLAVQDEGIYNNVDSIADKTETLNAGEGKGDCNTDHQGLEVKEFWLHRIKINGRVYRNMIATMVEDKTIVRFQENDYDYGLIPFIYCPYVKDYGKNTGHALTDRAYEIQKMANFIINQVFDESKIKLFGFYKYVDDSAFNPANFVARPAGLVKVGDLNNLQPVNPNINQLSFGITELQFLQNEFETTTGVPKFLTGTRDQEAGKDTATAKRLAAEGADTRFRSQARRFNEYVIKPHVRMDYAMIRQQSMLDPQVKMDIARRTQQGKREVTDQMGNPMIDPNTQQPVMVPYTPDEMLAKLPDIPSLGKVDINIVGFENVLDKADKAQQQERFIATVGGVAKYDQNLVRRIKSDQFLESYARNLSIDSDLLRNDEEMMKLDQQDALKQQQAMQGKVQMLEQAVKLGIDPKLLAA